MARIDSILGIVRQQGADELRVGVDMEPRMFARGAPKRLSIPRISEDTLRDLLGDILSPEREREMREQATAQTTYDAGPLGVYRVTFSALRHGFEAVFLNVGTDAPDPEAPPPITVGASGEAPEPGTRPGVERSSQVRDKAEPDHTVEPDTTRVTRSGLGDTRAPATAEQGETLPLIDRSRPGRTANDGSMRRQTGARASAQLSELVLLAAELGASDLHLSASEIPSVRVDGALRSLDAEPVADLAALLPLDQAALARLAAGESIDLALEIAGAGRVRVHTYPAASGLIAAVRLLPRAAPSFAALNMPFPFDDLVDLPHGLVLVCGAAGSGKSTTLAALAQEALTRRSLLLVTLEDPIEYTLSAPSNSLVRRRQLGRDVTDFASGLRDALRADPELLLIGELRDPETIALALTAAETGHLVLSSLHSGSAASAIERIVDASPPGRQQQIRLQLADSLRAVVAQRLLRRAHGPGRVPAVEVLRVTRAVGALIREGKTAQLPSVLQSSRREGMISLERSLADRVKAGDVRLEDARAEANDPEALAGFLGR